MLDTQCSNRLRAIEGLDSVRFDAIIEAAAFNKRKKAKRAKPTPISLSINVYGPPSIADEVGCKLSATSGFLQHPRALSQSVDYRNPQLLEFSDDETEMRALVGIANDSPSAQRARISDEISRILDSLSDETSSMESGYKSPEELCSELQP